MTNLLGRQLQLNKREKLQVDLKRDKPNRPVVCLRRLKPDGSGALHATCRFEFSFRHLPAFIAILQTLKLDGGSE